MFSINLNSNVKGDDDENEATMCKKAWEWVQKQKKYAVPGT